MLCDGRRHFVRTPSSCSTLPPHRSLVRPLACWICQKRAHCSCSLLSVIEQETSKCHKRPLPTFAKDRPCETSSSSQVKPPITTPSSPVPTILSVGFPTSSADIQVYLLPRSYPASPSERLPDDLGIERPLNWGRHGTRLMILIGRSEEDDDIPLQDRLSLSKRRVCLIPSNRYIKCRESIQKYKLSYCLLRWIKVRIIQISEVSSGRLINSKAILNRSTQRSALCLLRPWPKPIFPECNPD